MLWSVTVMRPRHDHGCVCRQAACLADLSQGNFCTANTGKLVVNTIFFFLQLLSGRVTHRILDYVPEVPAHKEVV